MSELETELRSPDSPQATPDPQEHPSCHLCLFSPFPNALPAADREVRDGVIVGLQHLGILEDIVSERVEPVQRDEEVGAGHPLLSSSCHKRAVGEWPKQIHHHVGVKGPFTRRQGEEEAAEPPHPPWGTILIHPTLVLPRHTHARNHAHPRQKSRCGMNSSSLHQHHVLPCRGRP